MYADKILVFSVSWWIIQVGFLFGLMAFLWVSMRFQNKIRAQIASCLGFLLILDVFINQLYMLEKGDWYLDASLPLYYCNIMAMFASFALITKKQWVYEISLYLGFLGPLQAILTPGFAYGIGGYYGVSYFFSHSITILTPVYLSLLLSMRPRRGSWWKSPLFVYWLAIPICILNYFSGANYSFLSEKPDMANIFNIGPWPFYVIAWLIMLTFTAFLLEKGVLLINKKSY